MSELLVDHRDLPGHGAFLQVRVIPERIGTLNRLCTAIGRWRGIVDAELEDMDDKEKRNPAGRPAGYDPFADEALAVWEVERAMYGQLAVSIASFTEEIVTDLCKT